MENIEKLLDIFSVGLFVRHESTAKDGKDASERKNSYYTNASPEAKESLKGALKEHLLRNLKKCRIGQNITYDYFLGSIRTASSAKHHNASVLSINPNLTEVISKLPELPDGESYAFPAQTSASIKLLGFNEDEMVIMVEKASSWIQHALSVR